jgi:predicted Holliday junction resolvase-like endonuclease
METEIIVGLIIAIIGLIGIVIKEYFTTKRLREELKARKEDSERKYQLKQQDMAFKQRKQMEDEKLKNEKIKGDNVKSLFSFLKNLR